MSEQRAEYKTNLNNDNDFKDFDEYMKLARVTANTNPSKEQRVLNWTLGVGGEAGEIIDLIKKVVFHGHNLNKVEIIKEMGDVLWYLANLSYELDISLGYIADKNIEKLRERYPEGFSKERSVNRVEEKTT